MRFPFNENNVDEVFVALNGDRLVEIELDFDAPTDLNAEMKTRIWNFTKIYNSSTVGG